MRLGEYVRQLFKIRLFFLVLLRLAFAFLTLYDQFLKLYFLNIFYFLALFKNCGIGYKLIIT